MRFVKPPTDELCMNLTCLLKLLYLSNVPVEVFYQGLALLHGLLSDYPTGKLRILERSVPHGLQPDRGLKGVKYGIFPRALPWFLRARRICPAAIGYHSARLPAGVR